MNTNKRGQKRQDVVNSVSSDWNTRLATCMKEKGLTRETFAKAFKEKYGTGNPTDVYRWLNVGCQHGAKKSTIGLPSYDTMKRIADFFGVTVGYLTGETDYETFEMERACNYLGITEDAGHAIRSITKGNSSTAHLCRFMQKENSATLCYLLTANSFKDFLGSLGELAVSIDQNNNPRDYIGEALNQIAPELRDLALEWHNCSPELNDDSAPSPTSELIEAINLINNAEDKDYRQQEELSQHIKLIKYNLYEQHLRLVDEIVCDEHLASLVGSKNMSFSSIHELMQFLKSTSEKDG